MVDETPEGPSAKKSRLHEFHCDPSDDVVIVSNDEVDFRASRYHFCRVRETPPCTKSSTDLLDISPPPSQKRDPLRSTSI
ncbi:uncharacterized protein L199_000691 [Kwoniella botswanensis]|uniref:uncharacterized protein n=1 Tax=Kwoniella botswanensis TaxID=1268659 RepID=UPI00315CF19C